MASDGEAGKRYWLYILLALVAPIIFGHHVLFLWRLPVPEFALEWNKPFVVSEVIPGGGAEAAGVQPGDIILDVGGTPFAFGQFPIHVGQIVALGVERGGRRLELYVPLVSLAQAATPYLVSTAIPSLTYWIGGTLLFWRRFRQREVGLLYVLCQAIAVALLFPPPSFLPWCRRAFWATLMSAVCIVFAPSLLLHFHVTYPVALGTPHRRRWVLGVLYGLAMLAVLGWLAHVELGFSLVWRLGILLAVLELVAVMVILLYVYFRRATADGRRRLRVIAPSVAVSVIPLAILYALAASFRGFSTPPEFLARLALLVAPIGYLIAVVRHNLFNIDRALNRTSVYLLLSLGILALYVGPVLLAYRFLPGDPMVQMIMAVGLTLLVGLGFGWTRTRVQRWVDRLFYGGWYDYPAVVEMVSDALARSLTWAQLDDVLTHQVSEMMQLHPGELWIGRPDAESFPKEGSPQWQFHLSFEGQVWGVWTVGTRLDGDDFTLIDGRILQTLAHQAEIALSNVLLVEALQRRLDEIQKMQHRLLRSREEEQARLARDLHDGPIQLLVGLNMQLGLLLSSRDDAPLSGELMAMRGEVRGLLSDLRRVCADLRPPMLDTLGLGAALRALAAEWSVQHSKTLDLDLPADAALRLLPGEVAVNLYRVIQEALANAVRHATIDRLKLCLAWDDGRLELTVEDDGCGFAVPGALHNLTSAGHFGLAGMQERVDLIGGELEIDSAPGQGTAVRVVWQG
jgi:signal transduction histidine kinase